jgi:hypothetical protein
VCVLVYIASTFFKLIPITFEWPMCLPHTFYLKKRVCLLMFQFQTIINRIKRTSGETKRRLKLPTLVTRHM